MTLYPLPTFSPPALTKAKGALSFAIHSFVANTPSLDKAVGIGQAALPTTITQLVIGCRRKVVIYSWKDGEAQEIKV